MPLEVHQSKKTMKKKKKKRRRGGRRNSHDGEGDEFNFITSDSSLLVIIGFICVRRLRGTAVIHLLH